MNINIIVMIIIMHYYTCISAHEYEYRVTIVNPLYYKTKATRRKNWGQNRSGRFLACKYPCQINERMMKNSFYFISLPQSALLPGVAGPGHVVDIQP